MHCAPIFIACAQADVQQLKQETEKPPAAPSTAKQDELQQLHRETDWVVVDIKKSDGRKYMPLTQKQICPYSKAGLTHHGGAETARVHMSSMLVLAMMRCMSGACVPLISESCAVDTLPVCRDKVNAAELAADLRLESQQRVLEAHAAAQEGHTQHTTRLTKDMELARLQGENHLAEKVMRLQQDGHGKMYAE